MAGLSYDPKIDSFLKRLGLGSLAHVESLRAKDTIDKIVEGWSNREEIKEKINGKIKKLEGLARENIEVSLRLLGDFDEK